MIKKTSLSKLIITLIVILNYYPLLSQEKTKPTEIPHPKNHIFNEYISQKMLGNYEEAIDLIENWTVDLNDPIMIETNLFRINELIKYPEIIEKGIGVFTRIAQKNEVLQKNIFLRQRIQIFLNKLYLRRGQIETAIKIKNSLGFINKFRIIGPFNKIDDLEFEKEYPPEIEIVDPATYTGKIYEVKWFDVNSDHSGEINIKELFTETSDSIFYLYKKIKVPRNNRYTLFLGKTGYTDLWIDGKKILSNRTKHNFFFDQYKIDLFLSAGMHRILIKIGDSGYDGIKISLRITERTKGVIISGHEENLYSLHGCELIKSTYFYSLDRILNNLPLDEEKSFLAGYLFYAAALNSDINSESIKFFNKSKITKEFSSASNYYIGLKEKNSVKKDYNFYESIKNNKNNIESLRKIVLIKLKNDFIYEAFPIIESIQKIYPQSHIYRELLAKAMETKGWDFEALKIADLIKRGKYPSSGYLIEERIKRRNHKFLKAVKNNKILYQLDRYNRSYIDNVIECYEKVGNYDEIIKMLCLTIRMFPNNVTARLKLAKTIRATRGAKHSLPYLAAAMKLSPYNKHTLFEMGITYHMMHQEELAKKFLYLSSQYDPNNFSLKRYFKILYDERDEIKPYLINEDPSLIALRADKYNNEPAIILLKEIAIKVLSDGSYDMRIHKIFKINDSNTINNFSRQSIITNPSTDRIENLKCTVTNNGNIVETSKTYKISLSDPESRLYYDLQSNIILVPSLRKGSIVNLSYTIKSKKGSIYRNYFGEKIIIGGNYRTIINNILISFPKTKHIYHHFNGIKKNNVRVFNKNNKVIYQILLENIPPLNMEAAMPHYSEILPCVYFTSLKNWDELFRWYNFLLHDRIKIDDRMRLSLKKIINEDDNKFERVRKIYNHINKEIRYVGFEFGINGIQPRYADIIYHTKMGDCKDITAVLIALLKEAGIDAKMALIKTRDAGKMNIKVPYLGNFNHAICYVALGNGFFIDGTTSMSGYKELPPNDRNVVAFVLDEKGYNFINTDSKIYSNNIEKATTEVIVLPDGKAKLKRQIYKEGSFAPMVRYGIKDKEKKLHKLSEYWNKKFEGTTVNNFIDVNMSLEDSVSYTYSIDIPSFSQIEDKEIIFKAFIIPSKYYNKYCYKKKRKFSIVLPHRWTSQVNLKYYIPKGFTIYSLPDNAEFKHEKFDAQFRFKKDKSNKLIEVNSIINFKTCDLELEMYQIFKKFTHFIDRMENKRIVLIKE